MRKVLRRLFACSVIGLLAAAAPASATTITPGDTLTPVPSTTGCPCSGPFLDMNFGSWGGGSFSGDFITAVYNRGGGLLDFMYQVETGPQSQAVQDLVMSSFAGWATDVFTYTDFDSIPTGKNPDTASRSADGSLVTFGFLQGLQASERSNVLVIRTNATSYTIGTMTFLGGLGLTEDTIAPTARTFAPAGTPAVPEPASLVLTGLGLGGMFARRRRRRN